MRCMRTGSGPKASMTSPLNRRLEPCSEPAGRPRSTEDVWQSPRFHLPPRHEGTLRIRRHGTGASMGQSQAARSAAVQVRQSFTDQRAGLDAPSGSAFRSLGCMCLDVCMQPLRADVVIMGSGMGGGTIAYALAQRGVDILVLERGGALAAGAGELVPARGIPRPPIQAGRTVARRRRPRVRSRRALRRRRQHEGLRREPSPVPRAGLHRGRAPGGDLAGVALGYADLEPYLRRGRADVPCRRHDRRGPDRARGAAPPSRTAPWSTSPTSPTSCRRRRTATRRSGAAPHPNRRPRSLATCLVGKAPRELRQR
jgi:hypothetical protein